MFRDRPLSKQHHSDLQITQNYFVILSCFKTINFRIHPFNSLGMTDLVESVI